MPRTYVTSFSTMDFTLTKQITFDNGTIMSAYFNVQNAFNAIPPDTHRIVRKPWRHLTDPDGEDLMGRYFTIGVRGNF